MQVNDTVKVTNSKSRFSGRTGKIIGADGVSLLAYLVEFDTNTQHQVWFAEHELEVIPPSYVKAIDLNRTHLWHWTTVTDYAGKEVRGVIHRIELSGDSRTRVVLRVMTQERESGGVYWSTFGDEVYVNQDADVEIGDLLPESERYGIN